MGLLTAYALESRVGWTPARKERTNKRSPWEGAILRGKGRPIVQYRDTLRSSVQKRLNRSRRHLGCGLGWAIGIVLHGGPAVLRDVAMATNFGTHFAITGFVGYNFGCMIASVTQFDSRVGFLGQAIR